MVLEHQRAGGRGLPGGRAVELPDEVQWAAHVASFGIDPMYFLHTKDPFERQAIWAITREAYKYREIRDRNLAAFIQEGIGKLLGL